MALWTNLLKQSANLDDTASPWDRNGQFTIVAATSVIPGQTAYEHTWGGVGDDFRAQLAGNFPSPAVPHTLAVLFENIDADESSSCRIWDGSAGIVSGVRYNWNTGEVTSTGSTFGSSVTNGVVEYSEPGPNGGAMVLLWTTATPDNTGVSREVHIFPAGSTTTDADDTVVLQYAGIFEASTYAPAFLVNGATVTEQRVIDLGDHKVSVRPSARYVDLDHKRRRASGKLSSTLHGDAVRRREWTFGTEIEGRTTGEELQRELDAPGTVHLVHNPLISSVTGVGAGVDATNVRRMDGPQEDHVRVTFDAVEVVPV